MKPNPDGPMNAVEKYNDLATVNYSPYHLAQHTTHHADCGCLTAAADAMRDELLAEIARLQGAPMTPDELRAMGLPRMAELSDTLADWPDTDASLVIEMFPGTTYAAVQELLARIEGLTREAERGREWDKAVSSIWQLDGVGPKTLRACIDSMSDLIAQETERADEAEAALAKVLEAEPTDVEAEYARYRHLYNAEHRLRVDVEEHLRAKLAAAEDALARIVSEHEW